jgi:hypothetical protein
MRLPRRRTPEPRRIPESPEARRYRRQRARDARRTRWQARRARLRAPLLTIAGLGCLSAAAFVVHLALGLAVAGVSWLALEWLTRAANPGQRG